MKIQYRSLACAAALLLCSPFALAAQWKSDQRIALTRMAVGEQIQLTLPRSDASTRFERIEVYAPDARVWVIDEQGQREIPRSPWLHFIAQKGSPAAFSMDPESGHVEGMQVIDGQAWVLTGNASADGGLALSAEQRVDQNSRGQPLDWACGGALEFDQGLPDSLKLRSLSAPAPAAAKGAPATRQARIAVDTDNEIMSLKFSNNTTNANNYIASLFALMNGIYEMSPGAGGLDLRLVAGDIFLRTATDPYSAGPDPMSGAATQAQLSEFGEFWRVNQTGVQRAFAMLLSGKSPQTNSASGIAWVLTSGNYCMRTGQVNGGVTSGHYSFNQVFRFNGSTAATDLSVIAHEVGHNLGAFHSHCTALNGTAPTGTGTMDQCFSGESVGATACYSGSVSCPGGGAGTLMSYCHFNPPDCGGPMTTFHPGHVTNLAGRIASNFPACITPVSGGVDPIFANGFE